MTLTLILLLVLVLVLALALVWFGLVVPVVYADINMWLQMICGSEVFAADSGSRTLTRNPVVILLDPDPDPDPGPGPGPGCDFDCDPDVVMSTQT